MSGEYSFVVTAATGGAAGSIMALVASYIRDKRREKMLKTKVRAVVKHELEAVRDLIQERMLDTAKSGGNKIPFLDTSIEVQRAERIIEALQYPTMSVEIRLIAFEPEMLIELQDVYLLIHTIKARRAYASQNAFYYDRTDLESWVESI